ncbi:hypothetical protein KUTeg_023650 [Tegillarca granosa]|uniref:Uncharacterized protein n=1 Tax=Tegillarca granosa TaxID=220873 RepID=A0ABQ9E7W3_TEGGR|nr:hypothetical protein KUTeg_023650 [Tegillarca granosa]
MKNIFKQSITFVRNYKTFQRLTARSSPSFLSRCVLNPNRLVVLNYSSSAGTVEYTNKARELQRQNSNVDTLDIDRLIENKYIVMKCCMGMWEDFPQGTMFDVGFIDTHSDQAYNPSIPVVLLLHDVFGNHTDFVPIIKLLAKLGNEYTRGTCLYDDYVFTHGTDEQVSFIDGLLHALKVERIDMVIGHGSGAHPATVFGAYSKIDTFIGHIMAVKSKQKPICLVYSGQDEMVETEIAEEFANVIGYDKSSFYVIDKHNKVKTKGDTEGFPKGLYLENGSHDPLNEYATSIYIILISFTLVRKLKVGITSAPHGQYPTSLEIKFREYHHILY